MEEVNKSAEVDIDTDGVQEQEINVEAPKGGDEAFSKKEEVDLGYTDVTGGAFTATTANTASTQVLFLNASELKQYIKVNKVVAGGTGAGAVSVTALFSNKYG